MVNIAVGLLMFVYTLSNGSTTNTVADASLATLSGTTIVSEQVNTTSPVSTEELVREYFKDNPLMVEIAKCESQFKHYDDNGEVNRGKANFKDVGVMQINEKYHLEQADKLGIDLHTIEGNLAYAKHLYEKQGYEPWKYSEGCWGKHRSELALK